MKAFRLQDQCFVTAAAAAAASFFLQFRALGVFASQIGGPPLRSAACEKEREKERREEREREREREKMLVMVTEIKKRMSSKQQEN